MTRSQGNVDASSSDGEREDDTGEEPERQSSRSADRAERDWSVEVLWYDVEGVGDAVGDKALISRHRRVGGLA